MRGTSYALLSGALFLSGCTIFSGAFSDPTCGNEIVEAAAATPEACDDGNTVGGDGCSADCSAIEECGNNILDEGEQCDDGNNIDGDDCSAACLNENADCGNGLIEVGEECDDANEDNSDGCSNQCNVENGFDCGNAQPSVCVAICGDGILINGAEQCDDNNLIDGDGCDQNCNNEIAVCGNDLVEIGEDCEDGDDADDDGCQNCLFTNTASDKDIADSEDHDFNAKAQLITVGIAPLSINNGSIDEKNGGGGDDQDIFRIDKAAPYTISVTLTVDGDPVCADNKTRIAIHGEGRESEELANSTNDCPVISDFLVTNDDFIFIVVKDNEGGDDDDFKYDLTIDID